MHAQCELMNVSQEPLSHTMKAEPTAHGAFECRSHLQLQQSPITSSHDLLHQAIPVSSHTS